MTLATWNAPFTDNVSLVPAVFLNDYVRTQIPRAIDGVGGGTYTPTVVIDIQGTAGLKISCTGAAARLQYGSRAVTRTSTSPIVNTTTSTVSVAYGNVAAGDIATVALDRLPDGSAITSVLIYHNRADGGVLPGTKVQAALFKTNITTGVDTAIVALTEDPTTPVGSYEAHHSFTLTPGAPETVDNTQYVYWVRFDGETAPNALTTVLYTPVVNLTITSQDEAP